LKTLFSLEREKKRIKSGSSKKEMKLESVTMIGVIVFDGERKWAQFSRRHHPRDVHDAKSQVLPFSCVADGAHT
jgi:hypothetical protein